MIGYTFSSLSSVHLVKRLTQRFSNRLYPYYVGTLLLSLGMLPLFFLSPSFSWPIYLSSALIGSSFSLLLNISINCIVSPLFKLEWCGWLKPREWRICIWLLQFPRQDFQRDCSFLNFSKIRWFRLTDYLPLKRFATKLPSSLYCARILDLYSFTSEPKLLYLKQGVLKLKETRQRKVQFLKLSYDLVLLLNFSLHLILLY